MPDDRTKALQDVKKAAAAVRASEGHLDQARAEYYAAVERAQAAGVSISEIARTLGVTRQAVQRVAPRKKPPRP